MIPTDLENLLKETLANTEGTFAKTEKVVFLHNIKKCSIFSSLEENSSSPDPASVDESSDKKLQEIIDIINSEELKDFADKNKALGIQLYRQLAILYGCIRQKKELAEAKVTFKQQLKENLGKNHWSSNGAKSVSNLRSGVQHLGYGNIPAAFLSFLLAPVRGARGYYLTQYPSEKRQQTITDLTNNLYKFIEAPFNPKVPPMTSSLPNSSTVSVSESTNSCSIETIVEKHHPEDGYLINDFPKSFTRKAFAESIMGAIDNISNPFLSALYLQKAGDRQTSLGKFIQTQCYSEAHNIESKGGPTNFVDVSYMRVHHKFLQKITEAENKCISMFIAYGYQYQSVSNSILKKLEKSLYVTEKMTLLGDKASYMFYNDVEQDPHNGKFLEIEFTKAKFGRSQVGFFMPPAEPLGSSNSTQSKSDCAEHREMPAETIRR